MSGATGGMLEGSVLPRLRPKGYTSSARLHQLSVFHAWYLCWLSRLRCTGKYNKDDVKFSV